jgi:hypothetical protein
MDILDRAARGLEAVSPAAPMTTAALVMALADAHGHPVSERDLGETPAIPAGATRAEYAALLRSRS